MISAIDLLPLAQLDTDNAPPPVPTPAPTLGLPSFSQLASPVPAPVPATAAQSPAPPAPTVSTQAMQAVDAAAPGKQAEVAAAAAEKRAAIGGPNADPPINYRNAAIMRETGAGLATATPTERDLATLPWDQLTEKYGADKSNEMFSGLNTARNQFDRDATAERSNGEAVADNLSGTGLGIVNSFYGLAATGAGAVNAGAGQYLSKALSSLDEEMQGKESYGLRTKRAADQDVNALQERDSTAQYEADKATDGSFVAGLSRFGRDFMNTASRTVQDPTLLSDNVFGGLGSVVSAAPLMGLGGLAFDGLAAGARALAPDAVSAASDLIGSAASKIPAVIRPTGQGIAGQVGLGAQIGGTAYQDTSEAARAQLADRTDLTDDQKTDMANRAGLIAAGVAAPIAVAGGMGINALSHGAESLVGAAGEHGLYGLEANPFEAHSLTGVAGHMLEESAQEALRSTSDQVGQNVGLQDQVNPDQTLSQGVGSAAASGAIGGLGGAGVTQSPVAAGLLARAAGRAVVSGAGAAIGALGSKVGTNVADLRAANEASGPLATAKVAEAANDAAATAPEDAQTIKTAIDDLPADQATDAEKAQGSDYADKVVEAMGFDEDKELNDPDNPVSDNLKATLTGSTSAFDAMGRLASVIQSGPADGTDTIDAALKLATMANNISDTIQSDVPAMQALPDESPAKVLGNHLNTVMSQMTSSPEISAAWDKADEIIAAKAKDFDATKVDDTADAWQTPDVQQGVQATIQLAHSTVDGGPNQGLNLSSIQAILDASDAGRFTLSDSQYATLYTSSKVLEASQAAKTQRDALGLKSQANDVSDQKETNTAPDARGQDSSVYHTAQIMQAIRSGNEQDASTRMQRFGQFVQSQQNKVAALNTHYQQGGGSNVPYNSVNGRTGKGYVEAPGQAVHTNTPGSESSIDHANTVGVEAQRLHSVYNGIRQTFPDLNGQKVEPVTLHPSLQGKPAEVAAKFKSGELVRPFRQRGAAKADPAGVKIQDRDSEPVPATTTAKAVTPEKVTNASVEKLEPAATEAAKTPADQVTPAVKTVADRVEPAPTADRAGLAEPAKAPESSEPPEAGSPKTTAEAFPNLLGSDKADAKIKSRFAQAFSMPKTITSRLTQVDTTPLAAMLKAVSSWSDFEKFAGTGTTARVNSKVLEAYQEYLGKSGKLIDLMHAQMDAYLAKRGTLKSILADDGHDITTFPNMKAMNIVEPTADGKGLQYNQHLLEGAVLAALQWLNTSNQFDGRMDEDMARALTNADPATADLSKLADKLGSVSGLFTATAKQSLANKIKEFWGYKANADIADGFVEGIPEAIAAELLKAIHTNKDITFEPVHLTEKDGLSPTGETYKADVYSKDGKTLLHAKGDIIPAVRTANFWKPTLVRKSGDPILSAPSLIEKAVLVTPKDVTYFDHVPMTVAQNQLKGTVVENTTGQKEMIEKAQAVRQYLNMPTVNVMTDLGKDAILKLFAGGDLTGRKLNLINKMKLDGQNKTVAAAYDFLQNLVTETQAQAMATGAEVDEVGIRQPYNVTRVGRLQAIGRFTTQSTKLIREALLSTRSTLDLSDTKGDDYKLFMLGVAQALGLKVNKRNQAAMVQGAEKLVEGDGTKPGLLVPTVEALRSYHEDGKISADSFVNTMKTNFQAMGEPITAVALHALTEYARYVQADDAERKVFKTSVYVEADGLSNGPTMAMKMLSHGPFDENWVDTMAKGGQHLRAHSNGPKNSAEQYESSEPGASKDIYEKMTDILLNTAKAHWDAQTNTQVKANIGHLKNLMDFFLPNFKLADSNGDIVMSRGIAKNPLTITIYGSGLDGIASKLTGAMLDEIYARMSRANEAMEANPGMSRAEAMFGPESTTSKSAELRYQQFGEAMVALQSSDMRQGEKGLYVKGRQDERETLSKEDDLRNASLVTYSVDGLNYKNLQSNMRHLFITPMGEAIKQTVGEGLLSSAKLIQQGTQTQGLFQRAMFKQLYQQALDEKDPAGRKQGLSRQEQQAIMAKVIKAFPLIQNGRQSYFVAGSNSADMNNTEFGKGYNGEFESSGYAFAPQDPGVAGIPFMVIGFGDGQSIQNLYTRDDAPKDALAIFDGINLSLRTLMSDSAKANQATFNAWQGNPLAAVSKMFDRSMPAFALLDKMSTQEVNDMFHALYGKFADPKGEMTTDDRVATIKQGLINTQAALQDRAMDIQARQNVMQTIAHNVDQMAAASSPYEHKGIRLTGVDHAQIAEQLEEMRQAEITKLQQESRTRKDPAAPKAKASDTSDKAPLTVGTLHTESGARILDPQTVAKFLKQVGMTPSQQAIYSQIRLSKSADQYKIVYGDVEQLNKFADAMSVARPALTANPGTTHGLIDPELQTIWMVSPDRAETLVHELIHASTFDTLLGVTSGALTDPVLVDTVDRLKTLMNTFKDLGQELIDHEQHISPALRYAVRNVRETLASWETRPGYNDAQRQAAGLAEFMAWGLANKELATAQAGVIGPLAQLAKNVLKGIRDFLFGTGPRGRLPAQGETLLSQLTFNASIIVRAQANDLPSQAAAFALAHNTVFGADPRLDTINDTFQRVVTTYLETDPTSPATGQGDAKGQDERLKASLLGAAVRRTDKAQAIMHAYDVAQLVIGNHFAMNPQQTTTFKTIVVAMTTLSKIDPNALTTAQELQTHVQKTLTADMLLPPGMDASHPDFGIETSIAEAKYQVIMGDTNGMFDQHDRSSMLPIFLGLAMVDDGFRSVLAKMPVPKAVLQQDNGLDGLLTNAGIIGMNQLGKYVSGTTGSKTVLEASDALAQRVRDVTLDKQTLIDQLASPAGTRIDRLNDWTVQALQYLIRTSKAGADTLQAKADNKVTRAIQAVTTLADKVSTDKNASELAMSIMDTLDRSKAPMWIHDQINDLVGRTEANKNVFDIGKKVRATIQADSQRLREVLPGTIDRQFKRDMTDEEYASLFRGAAKTDMAALAAKYSPEQIREMYADPKKVSSAISEEESYLKAQDPANWKLVQAKSEQLARYMNTGEYGSNFLRNPATVANLLNERTSPNRKAPDQKYVDAVDRLTTLYAHQSLSDSDHATLKDLAQNEPAGMDFIHATMIGTRAEEIRKAADSPMAKFNYRKGYIPSTQQEGISLVIRDDAEHANMLEQSYTRVGDVNGSNIDVPHESQGYYFSSASARSPFNQGMMQNVQQTVGGVDANTGLSTGLTAGRVTNPDEVRRITRLLSREKVTNGENLQPLFGPDGMVYAYERSADPVQLTKLNQDTHAAKMVGVWAARQHEERTAQGANIALISSLRAMYEEDRKKPGWQALYVDLLAKGTITADPVLGDAVKLISAEAMATIKNEFPDGKFWVRKSMLNDSLGYRSASVTDGWSGVTRWNKATQDAVKNMALSVWGNDAYRVLFNTEKTIKNVVRDAKTIILVKSIVVPMSNMVANAAQMMGRGIGPIAQAKAMPKKLAEVNSYVTSRLRQNEVQAELQVAKATGKTLDARRLDAEIQGISDAHRRLSIWPLIDAGEFSAVSDAGISREDVLLSSGRLNAYFEQFIHRLPGPLQTLGRYAAVTKDTALFQALEKSVEYGDFLAKSITYDHLTIKKGMTSAQALGEISEEFIDYDRLPGRARGALENLGLLWFYNYKIRSVKIAMSMVRRNPVHALLTSLIPTPSWLPGFSTPLTDNGITKGAMGNLMGSVGPGMLFHAAGMNPIGHLLF